jgi:hypothetical protein
MCQRFDVTKNLKNFTKFFWKLKEALGKTTNDMHAWIWILWC